MTMQQGNLENWQAVLTPHRSLSPAGFVLVMTLIAGVNLAMGTLFFALGAWPVIGFLGLDVLAIWWAFRANFSAGERAERNVVTPHEVILERRQPKWPPQEQRFVRRWVRLELEEDTERGLIGNLILKSRGTETVIGAFLPPEERKDFARQFRHALAIPRI